MARGWDDEVEGRDRFRERTLAATPRWYSPWLHLALTTGPGLVVLAAAARALSDVRLEQVGIVPLTFVGANLFEWHAHKNLLHRRWRLFPVVYDQHTPMHHRIYRYGDMAMRSWRELRLVLIPGPAVGGIVAMSAPVALGLGLALGSNVGWLFLVTVALYVVSYELSHLAYHLSPESWVGRRRLVAWLREHHARHHDPRLMQRWNFNVTVPLGDWLFGTFAPAEAVTEARQRLREPWRGESLGREAAPPA